MSAERRPNVRSAAVAAVCGAVIVAGAAGTYLTLRDGTAKPRQSTSAAPPPQAATAPGSEASAGAAGQTAKILVTEKGYEPDTVSLRAGTAARLTFVRTSDKTCATEVIFPSLNIKRALPLNEAVAIEFTPAKAGDITFACGMNMVTGTIVVR
jgi:hypothetical protein